MQHVLANRLRNHSASHPSINFQHKRKPQNWTGIPTPRNKLKIVKPNNFNVTPIQTKKAQIGPYVIDAPLPTSFFYFPIMHSLKVNQSRNQKRKTLNLSWFRLHFHVDPELFPASWADVLACLYRRRVRLRLELHNPLFSGNRYFVSAVCASNH